MSRSGNQGAPDPDAAKTRRGPARESHARSPSLCCYWPSHDSAPSRGSASLAKSNPGPPGTPGTRRQSPARRGDQSAPRAEPGLKLQAEPRRIPVPLGSASGPGFFPGPGRVFHSTLWLGEDGDALGAQGDDCGHKSPGGPFFRLLTRGGSPLASRPRPYWAPCFPGHGLGVPRLRGESS